MADGRGRTRSGARGGGRGAADEARIRSRFKRLGPQRRALVVALRPFSDEQGRFDQRLWAEAFESTDPEIIYRVVGAIGMFERLVNHLNGMLVAGARLADLSVASQERAPSTPSVITAIRDDGGLSANQAEVLIRLNRTRNLLQHASAEVQADDVHADVELLLKTLQRLVSSYVTWLERHGIALLPSRP